MKIPAYPKPCLPDRPGTSAVAFSPAALSAAPLPDPGPDSSPHPFPAPGSVHLFQTWQESTPWVSTQPVPGSPMVPALPALQEQPALTAPWHRNSLLCKHIHYKDNKCERRTLEIFKVGRRGRNARLLFNSLSYRRSTSTFLPVQMTLLMPQLHFLFTVIITLVTPSDVLRERPGPEPISLRATTGHRTAKTFDPPQLLL